jgi:MFS family permease
MTGTDDPDAVGRLEQLVRAGASFVAPATALSAVLFYFGYVSARSQYEYFGIDVDTIGMGTQDYIMRSPQPLLVPLLVLAALGIGVLALLSATRSWAPDHREQARRLIRACSMSGLAVSGAGLVLLVTYFQWRDWSWYSLVTPLLIGLGASLVEYAGRVRALLRPKSRGRRPLLVRHSSDVLVFVVIAVCVFWTTATVAQWSGRGLALRQARELHELPSVILDTKERLYLRSPGVEETALAESPGQTFRYRYRNLRLLIHGNNRMFLVPYRWSASDSTLVVELDGSVRVQFQFRNQRP